MISKPSKFEMDGVTFEANWCKSVTPCRSIRIKVKGKSAEINPNDLYALLMLYADEQQMSDCLGVKDEEVVMVKKLMAVRTKNDIKAGEQVTFTIEYRGQRTCQGIYTIRH